MTQTAASTSNNTDRGLKSPKNRSPVRELPESRISQYSTSGSIGQIDNSYYTIDTLDENFPRGRRGGAKCGTGPIASDGRLGKWEEATAVA